MDMNRLIPIRKAEDISREYRDTPIGLLLEYHNLSRPFDTFTDGRLLIGMCMDHRKRLRTPDNFAYIIRTGGANLQYYEFHISYAIAVGGVKTIALIGHTQCGMVNLNARRDPFVQGLVNNAGLEKEWAEEYFTQFAPLFEIVNELEFLLCEVNRLRLRFPKIQIVPLLYRVENNLLYLVRDN
jgi:carbonic anhydrase